MTAPVPILPPRTVTCADGRHTARFGNERVFVMAFTPDDAGGETGKTVVIAMKRATFREIADAWNKTEAEGQ